MQENGRHLPATIDQETGVVLAQETASPEFVIPGVALADLMMEERDGRVMPVHMVQLLKRGFSAEMEEALVSLFLGKTVLFDDVVNCTLPVLGMIIYQHPAFFRNVPQGEPAIFVPEGFYQVRFLCERDNELIVVASGSTQLAMVVSSILKNRGWWRFEKPVLYTFYKDRKSHCIANKVTDYKLVIKGEK